MNTVYPIKDPETVNRILRELEQDKTWHGQRMYLLFATGVYTGLRVSDLVRLRVGNVQGEYIRLKEQKTGKQQSIYINRALGAIFDDRLKGMAPDAFIFASRKRDTNGEQKPITTRAAAYDMQQIKRRFGITDPFACHSMRKTFGYRMYNGGQGATLEELRQMFNHSKEAVTRRYIGVDEELRNKHVKKLDFGGYMPQNSPQRARRRDAHGGEALETSWRHSDQHGQGPDKEPDKGH